MYTWLLMTLVSGVLLGFYDIFKKQALQKSSVLSVLAVYSLISFLLVSFEAPNALNISTGSLLILLLKSLVIFVSWIFGFIAIKHMPISIITPFGTLSPLFSVILGIGVLGERPGLLQAIGVLVIFVSYYFISKAGKNEIAGLFRNKYLYLMAASALLSATSALIDKIALKNINPGQMQFWFCLFVTVLYFSALIIQRCITGEKLSIRFSYAILLMSILIVLSDRIYFEAVKMPLSQISVIMPLRKVSVVVSAIIGGMIFKEKNLRAKLASVFILILGITLAFMK